MSDLVLSMNSVPYGLSSALKSAAAPPMYSWWLEGGVPAINCIAAYQPKGAASYVASKINLANPGVYDAFEGVAPGWAAGSGWIGDGASCHLLTGIVPNVGWSWLCQFAGGSGVAARGVCGLTTAYYWGMRPINTDAKVRYKQGLASVSAAPVMFAGNMAMADVNCYRNGIADGVIVGPWMPVGITVVLVSERTTTAFWNGSVQAVAIYDITLSPAQIAAIAGLMAAL